MHRTSKRHVGVRIWETLIGQCGVVAVRSRVFDFRYLYVIRRSSGGGWMHRTSKRHVGVRIWETLIGQCGVVVTE